MREENQQWSNKKCLVKGRPEWGSENRIWEVSVNWFSVNPKGNQSGIFIGRTDAEAEAEAPMLWPPDVKNWLNGKDPDAGKDWRQEKGTTEDEMVGWLHWLDGHESEQVLGVGDEQGSLACCSPWGCKQLDMTEQLNWTGRSLSLPLSPRNFTGEAKIKRLFTNYYMLEKSRLCLLCCFSPFLTWYGKRWGDKSETARKRAMKPLWRVGVPPLVSPIEVQTPGLNA